MSHGGNGVHSIPAAYVLWLLLGALGIHRFYLGRVHSGAAMMTLTLFAIITLTIGRKEPLLFGIGGAFLIGVVVWLLADAFLIPRMVEDEEQGAGQSPAMHPLAGQH